MNKIKQAIELCMESEAKLSKALDIISLADKKRTRPEAHERLNQIQLDLIILLDEGILDEIEEGE